MSRMKRAAVRYARVFAAISITVAVMDLVAIICTGMIPILPSHGLALAAIASLMVALGKWMRDHEQQIRVGQHSDVAVMVEDIIRAIEGKGVYNDGENRRKGKDKKKKTEQTVACKTERVH